MAGGLEALLAGRTLVGRYEIGEVIGRGGFAVVYRATDVRLGRPVAVKVITLAAHDETAREELRRRLHREARAAAGLPHHPNLVTVHDVGTDPELGLDFLVMELLRGENLAELLAREGKPPLEQALRILRGAAEGLAVGHRAGLVHRDVKPANLFLAEPHGEETGPYRVCVLDYGIAQAMEDDATMTRGGAAPLSPAFASPEQLRGERELSPASDVFSLGVVGYQLLTGERPFATAAGQAPTGWTVRRPLREANPAVTAEVDGVVGRAIRPDPAERFADADAFAEALDRALATPEADATRLLPVAASPIADDDHTMLAPAPYGGAMRQQRTVPGQPRRRRGWPAALVLALLLAAAAAWAALSGGFGGSGEPTAAIRADTAEAAAGEPAPPPPVDERTLEPAAPAPDAPAPAEPLPPAGEPAAPPAGEEPGAEPPVEPQPQQPQPQPPARQPPPAEQPQQPPAGEPQPPPARQPQPPPARQPQQPPEPPPPAAEPPPQPVIVQPRPAPPDTIRIAPPR